MNLAFVMSKFQNICAKTCFVLACFAIIPSSDTCRPHQWEESGQEREKDHRLILSWLFVCLEILSHSKRKLRKTLRKRAKYHVRVIMYWNRGCAILQRIYHTHIIKKTIIQFKKNSYHWILFCSRNIVSGFIKKSTPRGVPQKRCSFSKFI